jgi:dTDP-4-amino-4,6-dideoxygalactose transaminase
MSNILAGVGRGQVRVLDERVNSRRRIFERYQAELRDCEQLQWMPEPSWSFSTHWLSVATVRSDLTRKMTSSDLIKLLAQDRIEARPVWKPMHMQPVFQSCKYYNHGDVSVSRDLFENGICLPSGSNMTDAQQDRIMESIRKYLKA